MLESVRPSEVIPVWSRIRFEVSCSMLLLLDVWSSGEGECSGMAR